VSAQSRKASVPVRRSVLGQFVATWHGVNLTGDPTTYSNDDHGHDYPACLREPSGWNKETIPDPSR